VKSEEYNGHIDREELPRQRLLAHARARTEHEHGLSLYADTAHYAAAALGQSPYIALPNGGVIIVQKKGWGC
jgi:hypothetical protein